MRYYVDLLMIHICMSHNVDKEELEVVHDHVRVDHANREVFQRRVNVHLKDLNEYDGDLSMIQP